MNYPSGIRKTNNQSIINYGNRGMTLENDINQSNIYYREKDIAYIYKKPTPIKVTKLDFSKTKSGIIKEGFYEEPSTTDYNGVYKGYYLDFEAKETKLKTRFPFDNIHPHQIKHLRNITRHGGIGFLIVRFTTLNKTYLLNATDFFSFLEQTNRHSIPISYFEEKAYLIKEKLNPRLDYLEIINKLVEVN